MAYREDESVGMLAVQEVRKKPNAAIAPDLDGGKPGSESCSHSHYPWSAS